MNQKKYLDRKKWDHLIILDACRYDYFEKNYREYLTGDLMAVKSAAGGTSTWMKKVFGKGTFPDIVYISANPHVAADLEMDGFKGGEHFFKVVDVWDRGWENEVGTVPPENVNEAAKEARSRYPNKKLVIHYIQPHGPFPDLNQSRVRKNPLTKIRRQLDIKGKKYLGREKFRKLKELIWEPIWPTWRGLEKDEKPGVEGTAEKHGEDTLQWAYEKNLRWVLEGVSNLLDHLSGKIVITADHGEGLSSEEGFGHMKMDVPWLEIEKEERDLPASEKNKINARVKELKRKGEI